MGLTEFETLADPEIVDVFEVVVEAVTVAVFFRDAVAPIENVCLGLPDGVLDGGEERVKVTVGVDVLDWLEEPVMVAEVVPDLLAWEEAEYVPEWVGQADAVPLRLELGVGGESRVVVTVTVWVGVTRRPVSETVVVPVDVLELVMDRVGVGLPESVTESLTVRVGLREILGVYVARFVVVSLGEEDLVLLPTIVLDPVAEKVEVFEEVVLAVSVLEPPMLREPVADTVDVLVAVMVRVPLGEAVPVLLAVVVAVEVIVCRIVRDCTGERDTVALPVELREPRVERVSVALALIVLEGAMDRVGLADPVGVLD